MAISLLIDTDVLIDYLRGHAEAIAYLEGLLEVPLTSVITIAELYAGVREGAERTALDAFVRAFETVPIDEAISIKGGLYRREYGKSHGVGLADAIIAATVAIRQCALVTLNKKHFPMLTNVIVPYQKP
jgi:predicted nucleic acid-binding protein